jgi:alpha-galactosidase
VIDISIRAWVAAQRHMGFEMDPRELTEREATVLRGVTAWWKDNRNWMMRADILRLDSPDPAVIAEQQLAEDGSRFVAFVGKAGASSQIAPRPIRLTQLDPAAAYRVNLRNRDDIPDLSRGAPALKYGAIEVSGRYLMQQGMTLPWSFPATIWVVEGSKIA